KIRLLTVISMVPAFRKRPVFFCKSIKLLQIFRSGEDRSFIKIMKSLHRSLASLRRIFTHKMIHSGSGKLFASKSCKHFEKESPFPPVVVNHEIGQEFHHTKGKQYIFGTYLREYTVDHSSVGNPGHNALRRVEMMGIPVCFQHKRSVHLFFQKSV